MSSTIDDKLKDTDSKLELLAKKLDNISSLTFTIDMLEEAFPCGYHIMEVDWVQDEYLINQKVSVGYQASYEYTTEELPLTMESKYKIASKEEVDKSNEKFIETIETGVATDGYLNVTHKSGTVCRYYYRNFPIGHRDGKVVTIFGYQIRC